MDDKKRERRFYIDTNVINILLKRIICWSRNFSIDSSVYLTKLKIKLNGSICYLNSIRYRIIDRLKSQIEKERTDSSVTRRSWIDRVLDIAKIIAILVGAMMASGKPRKLVVLSHNYLASEIIV